MASVEPLVWRENRSRALWRELWFGPHGEYNQHWRDVMDRDPTFESVYMVVELIFGGGITMRVATAPLSMTRTLDGSQTTVLYQPLLLEEPEITHTYNLMGGGASQRSFAISVAQKYLDAFSLLRDGHMLAGWAEVSLAVDGQAWEDRFVIMRGDMSGGVVFGGADEIMEIEVVDPAETMDLSITPYICTQASGSTEATSTGNFINLPDSSNGQRFPLLLNTFNGYELIRTDATSSALIKGSWMIGWGHDHTVSKIYKDGAEAAAGWSVSNTYDTYGIPYTVVDTTLLFGTTEDTTAVHADATSANSYTGVLDVVRYLVEDWSLVGPSGYSHELHSIAQAKLGTALTVSAVINGSETNTGTTALSYVESTIVGSFPMVSTAYWGGGYGPVVTDRRSNKIRMELVKGQFPLADRVTSFQETPKEDLFNRFTFRYAYSAMDDVWGGTIIRDYTNSTLCRISEEMAGIRDFGTVDSVIISDPTTAEYVIDWLVAHTALPSYYVEYEGFPELFMKLRLGDNVTLSDDDLGTEAVNATVESISYQAGRVVVGLRLWMLYPELGGGTTGYNLIAGSEIQPQS